MGADLATHFCKFPGCTKEARSSRGPFAYCDEHRGKAAPPAGSNGGGLVAGLAALKTLARDADKLEAKAQRLRREADAAGLAAGEKRDEFARKMRELSEA